MRFLTGHPIYSWFDDVRRVVPAELNEYDIPKIYVFQTSVHFMVVVRVERI